MSLTPLIPMCVYKQANSENLKLLFLTMIWLIASFQSNVGWTHHLINNKIYVKFWCLMNEMK